MSAESFLATWAHRKTTFKAKLPAVLTLLFCTMLMVACTGLSSGNNSGSKITVQPGQVEVSANLSDATQGTAYKGVVSATGGTAPYLFATSTGALPPGLSLNTNTGAISGTPTLSGSFTFSVSATDASGTQGSAHLALLVLNPSDTSGGIPASFFNMHVNHDSTPWPSAAFAGRRLWDAGVSWALVNTAPGVYDWTLLDQRLADAKAHRVDVLYDLARTPVWAQCGPSTASPCVQTPDCAYASDSWGGGPGQCYWPEDLKSDGTGTNQHWKDWITALATHSANNSGAHIKYYEIWNEPNDDAFFRGTTAQLVRMTQDAACIIKGIGPGCTTTAIDSGALIVTPAPTYGSAEINNWMGGFLAAGGGDVVDVIGFHGYNNSDAEKVPSLLAHLKSGSLTTYNQTSKPLFDTEFSWGENVPFPDPDEEAGFVARSLLLHYSSGASRVYWYAWDASGVMWSANSVTGCLTPDPSGVGYTCQSGVAFTQLQVWMIGATLSPACSAAGAIWTCGFTRPGGYQALVIWDTAQSCSHGSCTTSTFTIPTSVTYLHYRDLAGNVNDISGSTIQIGYKPILLENK